MDYKYLEEIEQLVRLNYDVDDERGEEILKELRHAYRSAYKLYSYGGKGEVVWIVEKKSDYTLMKICKDEATAKAYSEAYGRQGMECRYWAEMVRRKESVIG